MKKYIIKNSDGSEQNVMKAVHFSSKDAGQTLWDYLRKHNDYGVLDSDDEGWVSPFDFIIEEVECKEVSEVITDFESARKILGLKPNKSFTVTKRMIGENAISLKDMEHLVADIKAKLNGVKTIGLEFNKDESDRFVLDWYLRSGYKPFNKKSNLLIKKLED